MDSSFTNSNLICNYSHRYTYLAVDSNVTRLLKTVSSVGNLPVRNFYSNNLKALYQRNALDIILPHHIIQV